MSSLLGGRHKPNILVLFHTFSVRGKYPMRLFSIKIIILLPSLLLLTLGLRAAELKIQPRILVNVPHVAFSTDVKQWLLNNPVIDVGIWGPSHPPIGEGMSGGHYQGIAADYLTLLEGSLQVSFRLHYFEDSSDAIAALSRHQISMMAMWNPERWPTQSAIATMPWLLDKSVLMTLKTKDIAGSNPKKITLGVVPDDILPGPLRESYPESTLQYFPGFDEAINALSFGQVDALWLNGSTAGYFTQYHQIPGLVITPSISQPNLNLSFGVDRQRPELKLAIDSVLQQIPLVSRMRIASGWGLSPQTVITRNPLGLNAQEDKWLRSQQRIWVLLDSRRPPLSSLNQRNEPVGLIVDILDTLTSQYGINFSLQTYDNDAARLALLKAHPEALQAGRWVLDDAGAVASSTFTPSLLDSSMVVVMAKSVKRPASFNELKDERLAINRDNPLIPWLQTWYPLVQLTLTDNLWQAYDILKAGKVRGVIAPQFVANYLSESSKDFASYVAVTIPSSTAHLMLTASVTPSLPLQIVSKALSDLPPVKLMELTIPWRQLPENKPLDMNKENLWISLMLGLLALLVIAVSGFWIHRLRMALRRGRISREALADQLNFTQTLINNSPVALYARDREGLLLHYNQTWANTLQREGETLLGKAIGDISSMELSARQHLAEQYQYALENGEKINWSGPFSYDGKQRYLQGWTVPWRDNKGDVGGLIGGWLDITDRESLIVHLKQAKKDLEQANASKAAFMQTMGHEIRTPLNAIIGLLEIELQSQNAGIQSGENLTLVWESANNLLSLIGDVFDIFRADDPKLQGTVRSLNLPQLIQSTVALYRLQAEMLNVKVELDVEMKTDYFDANALLLIRIFSSLLRNAIKHTTGDTISVALYQGRQESESGMIPLIVEIANQGEIYRDSDPLPMVNDPESEDLPNGSDTGASLAACKKMATTIGAELVIESDAEIGTVISLHCLLQPSVLASRASLQETSVQLTVMIVDDYPPGRKALQQQLENFGHQVILTENGEQALVRWLQQPETLDLIITDCTMPVMDGFTLTERIREEELQRGLAALPIFGLTALTGFEATIRCLEAGMNECLTKPLSPQALQAVLQRYFPQTSPLTASSVPSFSELREIKISMVEINRQDAAAMKNSLNQQHQAEVGRLAHRIRGGSGLLDQTELTDLCAQLEAACEKKHNWSQINELAEQVLRVIDNLNATIMAELNPIQTTKRP